jgi:hypothetical protein
MEEKEIKDEEIQEIIKKKRNQLLGNLEMELDNEKTKRKSYKDLDSIKRKDKKEYYDKKNRVGHELYEAKHRKNDIMKDSLKISKNYKVGSSFEKINKDLVLKAEKDLNNLEKEKN